MIEEHVLSYEVALVRKAKLHCHMSAAIKFAYDNGRDNLTSFNRTLDAIENEFKITESTWAKERCSTNAERAAKASMVIWMRTQGFNLSAIARIMDMSISSVRWNFKLKETAFLPSINMRIFDSE